MNATSRPQQLGRYAIYDRIASGGMATVYFGQLVASERFSRIVAVKRLHPHLSEEREFATMLLDEAYLAGRIHHPNVVSTIDIVSANDELIVVMDYVHGESLGRLMKTARTEEKPIPLGIAVAIVAGVLKGLHAAHETTTEKGEPLRIVHRDVSPQNVVVGVDGIPRLLDFGVAKAQYRLQTTQDGRIKGKLSYMAPEQLTNRPVDRRADLYGAGVILWELLTGRRLVEGDFESFPAALLAANHPRPCSVVPSLPAVLDEITMRALSRDPSGRYETAHQMALALEKAAPTATSTTVGDWVAVLAEPRLEERAQIMRRIEAGQATREDTTSLDQPPSTDVDFEPSKVRKHDVDGGAKGGPRSTKRRGWYAAAGALAIGLVAATLVAKTRGALDASTAAPATEVSPTGAPLPSGATSASPLPSASPSVSAPVAADTGAAPAPSSPSRSHVATPPAPLPSHARVRVPPTRHPDCNPPYVVDDIGVRHYKPECSM
jgi:eukaryotic-like serine/threonine-protein kinase